MRRNSAINLGLFQKLVEKYPKLGFKVGEINKDVF